MNTTTIFSVIKTFVVSAIVFAMHSCAGETLIISGTVADGVSYTFDNDTKEAIATGYVVVDGGLLTKIYLPDELTSANNKYRVTAVEGMAFVGASACETVEIGANVRTIGAKAFSGCTAIKVVKINGLLTPVLSENVFEPEVYTSATLFVPDGCDISSTNWCKFNNIVEQ